MRQQVSGHPLKDRVFRIHMPFRGRTRAFLLRVLGARLSKLHGSLLRVRTLPMLGMKSRVWWVQESDLTLALKTAMAGEVDSLPCGRCGSQMIYDRRGQIDGVCRPFFACNGCEQCIAV